MSLQKPLQGSNVNMAVYTGAGTPSVSTFTVSDMNTGVHSVGIVKKNGDGVVTKTGAGTISITAGGILIRPTDDKTDTLEFIGFASIASYDVGTNFPTSDEVYVYLDYTNGAFIQYSDSNPDSTYSVQNIMSLAEIHMDGAGTIDTVHDVRQFVGNHPQEFTILHRDVFGVLISGQDVSEIGARNLQITSGIFHKPGYNNISADGFNSSGSDTFSYWYTDDSGVTWTEVTSQSQLDTNQYNDITSGLSTIPDGKFKKDWIYRKQDGTVTSLFGNNFYNNELDALEAPEPIIRPPLFDNDEHLYLMATWHKIKETASGKILDRARRQPNEKGDAVFAPLAPRNYTDLDYFNLVNLFWVMAEADAEKVRLPEILRNMYIDTFTDESLIARLQGITLTGETAQLKLNRKYSGDSSVIEDYELDTSLRQCNFGDCSAATWKDSTIQGLATSFGISAFEGTDVGRVARGADPGAQNEYWTCLLTDNVGSPSLDNVSLSFYVYLKSSEWTDGTSFPLTMHLRKSGGNEFYASAQTIDDSTPKDQWIEFIFDIQGCDFRDTITEIGTTLGAGVSNTNDIIIYVDSMSYSFGTVKIHHGMFKRVPLVTPFDVTETLTDRKIISPLEIGFIENHISIDGGVHFKREITLGEFIKTETGGEIETPDSQYVEDETLTQQAITFRYQVADSTAMPLFVHEDNDFENPGCHSDELYINDFSINPSSDFTEDSSANASVTWQSGTSDLDLNGTGNNAAALYHKSPFQAAYNAEQYICAKANINRVDTVSDMIGICVRTTSRTALGFYAGFETVGGTTYFVIGKDSVQVEYDSGGTPWSPTAGVDYVIDLAIQDDLIIANKKYISARVWNATKTTLLKSLSYNETVADTATGNIGFCLLGNSAGLVGTFDDFTEYYGFGEYIRNAGTNIIEFIPGREPSGTIKGTYLKDYAGSWNSRKSLVILAEYEKELLTSTLADTPIIDDFLQIAKVDET